MLAESEEMKPLPSILAVVFTFASMAERISAAEVVVVPWDQSWDYHHPMGRDPVSVDADFNATWFLKAADFAASYNGPAFGGAAVVGNAGDTASFDKGSGAGPFGYGAINYFTAAGAEMTAFGTALTTPTNANRYTAYFRTTFTLAQAYTSPRIRMVLDDGALVYLDGVLVARVNKADNTEGYTSFASDTTATRNETGASSDNEVVVQSFTLGTAGTSLQADSTVVIPVPTLAAGVHTLAVSARNNAVTSSDMVMGLQMLANDAGLSAQVSDVQRQLNGPGFADDTFTFKVAVTALNMPGATTWTSDNAAANGPVTGAYAPTVYTYTYPAQVNSGQLTTATIKFTDSTDPLLSSTVVVTAPAALATTPLVLAPATPVVGTAFEEAGLGQGNFQRSYFNTELGFTSSGAVVNDALANGTGSNMLRFVGSLGTMTSEAVQLDPSVKGIKAGLTMRSYTTSGTGFELDDSLRVSVETSPDGTTWSDVGSVLPLMIGVNADLGGIDQLITATGPGAPGSPVLKSRRGWSAAGAGTGPAQENLDLPPLAVPAGPNPVQVEFTHRYSFEYDGTTRWDGGAVMVSVNGGPYTHIPATSFTQNSYIGTITGAGVLNGFDGFNGDSAGYGSGSMITSVLTVPGVLAGDTITLQFLGSWDENTVASSPNWEINNVKVTSGATVLFSDNFAGGPGAVLPSPGWVYDDGSLNPGPSYYSFGRSAIPVPAGHRFARFRIAQPLNVALSTSEVLLFDGMKLEIGADPLADNDGDGVSNGEEDFYGTNPLDKASAFRAVQTVSVVPGATPLQRLNVSMTGVDLRVYKLQSSDDLGTWTDVETRFGDAFTPLIEFTAESIDPKKFWRVQTRY